MTHRIANLAGLTVRKEAPRYAGFWDWNCTLYNDFNPDITVVKAAHRRGMEVWGVGSLFDQFRRIVDRYKGITFVGAHQLYVGDATLAKLFAAHPNLTIDTSCGYFLRWGDQMIEEDAAAAREFLCAWPDRVLFATDNTIGSAHCNEVHFEAFRCHLRYLKALHLPQDVLDKIAWQNARRIFKLHDGDDWMTATTRP